MFLIVYFNYFIDAKLKINKLLSPGSPGVHITLLKVLKQPDKNRSILQMEYTTILDC